MIEAPNGYRFEETDRGLAMRSSSGIERIELTNRTFDTVNSFYYDVPEVVIRHELRQSDDEVHVVDFGGGYKSASAQGIAQRFSPRVEVTNVDLVATPSLVTTPNVTAIQGDALAAAEYLPRESVDVATTTFMLRVLNDPDDAKARKYLRNVAKVLKPDGIALIDRTPTPRLEEIVSAPDVDLISTTVPDVPMHFMVLSKEPLPGALHSAIQTSIRQGYAFVEERTKMF
jgi:ubiquinone/menaquinone biosynthesis C-methylase UbiE